jgi:hypothetical protein
VDALVEAADKKMPTRALPPRHVDLHCIDELRYMKPDMHGGRRGIAWP